MLGEIIIRHHKRVADPTPIPPEAKLIFFSDIYRSIIIHNFNKIENTYFAIATPFRMPSSG